MQIVIELPDNICDRLQLNRANLSHRILELIAADSYCQGRIGAAEVRRMLDLSSRWETYEFLKHEKADLPYSEEDLDQDVQSIQNIANRLLFVSRIDCP
jgi:predicted HTH domain antitoxin